MAMGNNSGFTKPFTLGVNLENGFFSEDGASGFNLSAYAGRLNFSCWKKGEKSGDNRDNKLSLNVYQAMILNNYLQFIITSRHEAFKNGGVEAYQDITNLYLNVEGFVNGQTTLFGVIRFDTVEIEGIKRVKLTITRGSTVNTIVFCDRMLKGVIPEDSNVKTKYDIFDMSFIRFCTEVNNWLNFGWSQGAFNKIGSILLGGNRSSGGGSGSTGSNSTPRYDSSGPGDSNIVEDDGMNF